MSSVMTVSNQRGRSELCNVSQPRMSYQGKAEKEEWMHLAYVALHEVTWSMVVWCTQNAPRRQQFHVAPARPAL